jgi:hypothetical protein
LIFLRIRTASTICFEVTRRTIIAQFPTLTFLVWGKDLITHHFTEFSGVADYILYRGTDERIFSAEG